MASRSRCLPDIIGICRPQFARGQVVRLVRGVHTPLNYEPSSFCIRCKLCTIPCLVTGVSRQQSPAGAELVYIPPARRVHKGSLIHLHADHQRRMCWCSRAGAGWTGLSNSGASRGAGTQVAGYDAGEFYKLAGYEDGFRGSDGDNTDEQVMPHLSSSFPFPVCRGVLAIGAFRTDPR